MLFFVMNKIQRIPSENARGCFSLSSSSFDFRETSVGDLFRLSEMSSRSGGDFFFFADRDVLEVETPLISKFGVTDPHINAIPVLLDDKERYYLQTSPEYGMKRLLAAGSGAIYQLTKAFREVKADTQVQKLQNQFFENAEKPIKTNQ